MIRTLGLLVSLSLAFAGCGGSPQGAPDPGGEKASGRKADATSAPEPVPEMVRVRIETQAGNIDLELDGRRAPVTTGNFLAYADQHRFDGTTFYRASRTRGAPERGFIQGGIRRNYRLMLPPIAHESTDRTGLRHVEGTISMARTAPGTAMGEFFITASAMPSMDADPAREGDKEGFAAFGRVIGGMDVVRRILASPTLENAGRGAMRGQMIERPVAIVRVRRLEDGGGTDG